MLEDYQNKVCVVTGAASGIGKALCEKLVALGAQVYALDRNKADIEGLSAFVETDLSDKGSIDAAFGVLPQVIDRFFGVAGLSGARTSYWLTFTVNFIANKYMTDTYLEKRIPSGGSIAYVTSCGGLMWEKWRKEYVKVMDCKTWDEMVAFMKSVSPKDGVGVMAYTLSKRAMNYYTSLKAVELGKRGIRVNALLPGSTDTGMKKEFEKMAGGQDNLVKENGGAGRNDPAVFHRIWFGLYTLFKSNTNSRQSCRFFPFFLFVCYNRSFLTSKKLLFIAMFGRNCRAYDLPSALRSPGSKIAGSDRMFRERPLWGFPMRWPRANTSRARSLFRCCSPR